MGCCFSVRIRKEKEEIVPSCPLCDKKEEVPFKELPRRRQERWFWYKKTEVFFCKRCAMKVNGGKPVENKKSKNEKHLQRYEAHKEEEMKKKMTSEERMMKRLPSGTRWERTPSFEQPYWEPDHVKKKVERIQENNAMKRKNSGITPSTRFPGDVAEDNVVHHPSDRANRRSGEGRIEGFVPHDIDEGIMEEDGEGEESPRKVSQQLRGEGWSQSMAGGSPGGSDKSSCWGEVDELVDTAVTEKQVGVELSELSE